MGMCFQIHTEPLEAEEVTVPHFLNTRGRCCWGEVTRRRPPAPTQATAPPTTLAPAQLPNDKGVNLCFLTAWDAGQRTAKEKGGLQFQTP